MANVSVSKIVKYVTPHSKELNECVAEYAIKFLL